jgi:hypothetical protein
MIKMQSKYKRGIGQGWRNESARHSLSARGIKTAPKKIDYMYSLETIKSMNRETAKEAKESGKKPLLYSGIPEDLRSIPNIGDYRPKGWKLVDTYFVDSSGLGLSGEPALTFSEFARNAKVGYGYAIIEAGQFQVYIGEFKKISDFAKKKYDLPILDNVEEDIVKLEYLYDTVKKHRSLTAKEKKAFEDKLDEFADKVRVIKDNSEKSDDAMLESDSEKMMDRINNLYSKFQKKNKVR